MLLITLSLVLLATQVGAQVPLQSTFGSGGTAGSGLTGPIEDIASLSASEFTTLVHPSYPAYSVRIKQNGGTFCDETVRSYTGYLDVQARHLFFYFFESRNDPKKDDVILWTNGGPGCSSSLGLLMELGPCRIKSENSTVYNPYAWNSKANIIFIDQPVGVGFSYADYGETIETTEDAAQDIAAFMRLFFDQFTEFQGRPFHLAGESYGGRYIPTFGAAIVDDNKKAVAAGLAPVNLVSIMIGKSSDIFDQMGCEAASTFCETELHQPFYATGKNVYDVSKQCEGDISETLCYPITLTIAKFLNRLETREMLGVHNSAANFSSCSNPVGTAFSSHLDEFSELTQYYVAELLERKVKVLLYIGTYDMICNWVGNERFSLAMKWSGQEKFAEQELRDWKIDGKRVGKTRSYGGLSFVTIEGAGHMVPYDKPVEALELLDRWLLGKQF
ncbi:serine carboxypeptidase [Hysterangium stoloniferum]|nr:serine carboxypeptidase [Hysterangium stoloniferum]